MDMENRGSFLHTEFIVASKEDKHTAVVGFGSFIYSVWMYIFFFLNYFLICLSKRRPLTWEFIQKYKENYECCMPHIQQESILQKHKSSC